MTPTKEELQEMLNSINNTITKLEERRKQLNGSDSNSTTGATSEPGDTFGLDDEEEIAGLTRNESNAIRGNERSVIRGLDSIYTSMSSGNYYVASPEVQANLEALRNATQGLNAALVNAKNNPNGSYSEAFEKNLQETGRLIKAQRDLIKAQTNQIKAASKDEQRNNQLQAKLLKEQANLLKEQIEQLKTNLKNANASAGNNSNTRGILDVLKTDMSELFPSIFKTPEEVAATKRAKEAERAAKAKVEEEEQQQSETEKRNAENFERNFEEGTKQIKPIVYNCISAITTKDKLGNLPDDNAIRQTITNTLTQLSKARFAPNSVMTQFANDGKNGAFDSIWNRLKENIKREDFYSFGEKIFNTTVTSMIQFLNGIKNGLPDSKKELYRLMEYGENPQPTSEEQEAKKQQQQQDEEAVTKKFDQATSYLKAVFDDTIKKMMTFDENGSFGNDAEYKERMQRMLHDSIQSVSSATFDQYGSELQESVVLDIVDDIYQEGIGARIKAGIGNSLDAFKHRNEIKQYQNAVQDNALSDKLWNNLTDIIKKNATPDTSEKELFESTKKVVTKYFGNLVSNPIEHRNDFFKLLNIDPTFQSGLNERKAARNAEANKSKNEQQLPSQQEIKFNQNFEYATKYIQQSIKPIFFDVIREMITLNDDGTFKDENKYITRIKAACGRAIRDIKNTSLPTVPEPKTSKTSETTTGTTATTSGETTPGAVISGETAPGETTSEEVTVSIVDDIYQEGIGDILNQPVSSIYDRAKTKISNARDDQKINSQLEKYKQAFAADVVPNKVWNDMKSNMRKTSPNDSISEIGEKVIKVIIRHLKAYAKDPIRYRTYFINMIMDVDPASIQNLYEQKATRTATLEMKEQARAAKNEAKESFLEAKKAAQEQAEAEYENAITAATDKLKPVFFSMLEDIVTTTNGINYSELESSGVIEKIKRILATGTRRIETVTESYVLEAGLFASNKEYLKNTQFDKIWNNDIMSVITNAKDPIEPKDVFPMMQNTIIEFIGNSKLDIYGLLDKIYGKKEYHTAHESSRQGIHVTPEQRKAINAAMETYEQLFNKYAQELLTYNEKGDITKELVKLGDMETELDQLVNEYESIEIIDDIYQEGLLDSISSAVTGAVNKGKELVGIAKSGNIKNVGNMKNAGYSSMMQFRFSPNELFEYIAQNLDPKSPDPEKDAKKIVYGLLKDLVQNAKDAVLEIPAKGTPPTSGMTFSPPSPSTTRPKVTAPPTILKPGT